MNPSDTKQSISTPLTGTDASDRLSALAPFGQAVPLDFLEALSDAVVVADLTGSIQFCNTAWCRKFNKTSVELLNKKVSDVVGESGSTLLGRGWPQVLSGRSWQGTHVEQENRSPSWNASVDLHLYPYSGPDGAVASVIILVRAATTVDNAPGRLCDVPLLPTVFGTIAHDLNNMTTVLNCTIDLTLHGDSPSPDDLREMQASIKEVEELVATLMLLCGRSPIERSRCRINDVLKRAKKLMRHVLPQGCAVNVRTAPGHESLEVLADPTAIEFVIVCMAYGLISTRRELLKTITLAARSPSHRVPGEVVVEVSCSGSRPQNMTQESDSTELVTARDLAPSMLEESFIHSVLLAHGARLERRTSTDGGVSLALTLPFLSGRAGDETQNRKVLLLGGTPLSRAALAMPLEARGFQMVSSPGELKELTPSLLRTIDVAVWADSGGQGSTPVQTVERLSDEHPGVLWILLVGSTSSKSDRANIRFLPTPCTGGDVAEIIEEVLGS